jgi:hypothetical protein
MTWKELRDEVFGTLITAAMLFALVYSLLP